MYCTNLNLKIIVSGLFLMALTACAPLGAAISPTPIRALTVTQTPRFTVTIPQKALWKNYVTVSAEASPGTSCELTYVSPSGEIQTFITVANPDSLCVWRWKIEETQGKGSGRLIFTIDGVSETHFIEILPEF
jgi:hypothetical protein